MDAFELRAAGSSVCTCMWQLWVVEEDGAAWSALGRWQEGRLPGRPVSEAEDQVLALAFCAKPVARV